MNYRSMLNMFNSKLRLFSEPLFLDFQNTQCIHLLKLLFSVIIIFLTISPNFLRSLKKWKSLSHVRLFASPWLYSLCNSPGQNSGVGSLSILQQIFLTQGSNWGLLHCRRILYQLSYQGSPSSLKSNLIFFISVYLWLTHQLIASYTP